MEIKYIDKLEDLKNYKWEYRGKNFILYSDNDLVLKQTDTFDNCGLLGSISLRYIGLANLTELEFYGLKVILNEKPKLTRKERYFLECHGDNIYFARDRDGELNIYSNEPHVSKTSKLWFSSASQLKISDGIFDFVSWESGKAWSKAELMELEVVD